MKLFNKGSTKIKRKLLRENETETEKILWNKIKRKQLLGVKFFRQYGIGEYIVDFYCTKFKLVIELDGNQHYTKNGLEYDKVRKKILNNFGIKVIRFSNEDVLNNFDRVLKTISENISASTTPPTPSL